MLIPGVVAAASGSASVPSSGLYEGATVVIDFAAGVYSIAGVDTAIADMIDRVDTISGAGLTLDWNTEDLPIALLSPVIAAIDWSQYTVLFDFMQYDAIYRQNILHLWNGEGSVPGRAELEVQTYSDHVYAYDMRRVMPENTDRDATITVAAVEGGRRKIGMTRATDRLALSHNGSTPVTFAGAATAVPAYTEHALGGYVDDGYLSCNAVVKKIIFYPPLPDADLPLYTA